MHRHHPYGGAAAYEGRRAGTPPGPGPDRNYGRFDRGGGPSPRGRGRGRGGGYGGPNQYGGGDVNYEQNGPGYDTGGGDPYNQWGNNGMQDPYYGQDAGYGGDYPPYGGPPGGYEDQNYGSYEDGPPNRGGRGGRRGGGGGGAPPRRERDDKVPDNIIEERIMRERPCRTLFIRNIKYETDSDYVRKMFEEHGEIKTFFDRIANRGMVFVTYYDVRAAERARERLQDTEISGRPIDVHYSLPRPDEDKDGKDQNSGTMLVTLRSPSGQPIDDNELRRRCSQFGDVKNIKAGDNVHSQRFVEYFDLRGCEEAFERLRHQPLQDGMMELAIVPDIPDVPLPPGPLPTRRNDEPRRPPPGRDFEEAPPRGRRGGRGRNRGPPGPKDDWERRDDDWDRGDRRFRDDGDGRGDRGGRRGGGGRNGGGRGRGGGGGGGGGGGPYGDRPEPRGGNYGGPPGPPPMQGNYGPPGGLPGPPPLGGYGPSGGPPAPQNAPPVDDRLQQARKVQELLAALKQPAQPPAGAPPPPQMPGMPQGAPSFYPPGPPPGMPGAPPPPASMYGGAPGQPPPNPYGLPPPQAPQPGAASGAPAALPPNILAMLQQATQQASPPPGSVPPPQMAPPYGMAPPGQPPAGGPSGQDYQQLMAFLAQAAAKR